MYGQSDIIDKGISNSNRKSKKTIYLTIGLLLLAVAIITAIIIIIIIIKKRKKHSENQETTCDTQSQEIGCSAQNSNTSQFIMDNPLYNDDQHISEGNDPFLENNEEDVDPF